MSAVVESRTLDRTIDAGIGRLLELQDPGGWWVGELESNATMTAEHLFWLHFLGLRDPDTDRRLATELLARRRDDGTWSKWWDGPPDLSTTVEAYVALAMAGVDAGDVTRAYITGAGGIAETRVFTKCFLALLDLWPWQEIPTMPVELVLSPASAPLSVYTLACWARQTVVPLSVVQAIRPSRPAGVDLSAIGARPGRSERPRPPSAIRRRAMATAEQWVRDRQEGDGSWGGIQPPWVWSIVMLAALGRGFDDPCLRRAVEGWSGFLVVDGDRLRPEACQSPVWDTALAVLALCACGVPADHPALERAGAWLLDEEVSVSGDWAVQRTGLPTGGWAFEFDNDLYPDVDDAAVVCVALRELGIGDDARGRGLDWIAGMQSSDGGWGAFDIDNTATWLYKIPFFDFGAIIDPPSEDVSAHALEALGPDPAHAGVVRRGLHYLLGSQQPEGSWWGRWGVNHLYGTGAALPALEACGVPRDHEAFRRAVRWLDSVQDPSGGFGEDIRSYDDPAWRGRGVPTASQTAWALVAYVAAGKATSAAARRAADFLCATQLPNGDWDERHFTGTGFPTDFMIRYHLYRLHFPLIALGRFRQAVS